jgi:hypothetical protein
MHGLGVGSTGHEGAFSLAWAGEMGVVSGVADVGGPVARGDAV